MDAHLVLRLLSLESVTQVQIPNKANYISLCVIALEKSMNSTITPSYTKKSKADWSL